MQLKTSAAKRSEYGDSAKYVTFTAADSKGNATGGKVKGVYQSKAPLRKIEDLPDIIYW